MKKISSVSFLWTLLVVLAIQASGVSVEVQKLPDQVLNRLSPNSLNRAYKRVYSQSGEDGVAEEIFRRLNICTGFCVEFGAYDGNTISNTRLLLEKGWAGALIESDETSFQNLIKNYRGQNKVLCINEFVGFPGAPFQARTFDQIADHYFPNVEIDFLSIDIDGADYAVLETLEKTPRVICIEAGLHWHPLLKDRIPDIYGFNNLQQPLEVFLDIAKKKGYQPVCLEGGNLFLVRNDLYVFFPEVPRDTLTLWQDGWRSAYESQDYLVNFRANNQIIRRFEKDLNKILPITKTF